MPEAAEPFPTTVPALREALAAVWAIPDPVPRMSARAALRDRLRNRVGPEEADRLWRAAAGITTSDRPYPAVTAAEAEVEAAADGGADLGSGGGTVGGPREPADIEAACVVMHEAVNSKPWAEVSEANKATMRVAVAALLDWIDAPRPFPLSRVHDDYDDAFPRRQGWAIGGAQVAPPEEEPTNA